MHNSLSIRWLHGVCGALLLLCVPLACRQSQTSAPLPPMPTPALERFAPGVRAEAQKAWDAVQASPNDPAANGKMGMILHSHEQTVSAVPFYERARLLEPSAFRWDYYLGLAHAAQGNTAGAIEAFRACLKKQPDFTPAKRKLADALLDSGDTLESGAIYAELVRRDPASPTDHFGQGRIQAAKGEWDAAIASYTKACKLFDEYGPAHYALAQALRRQSRESEARQHLARYEENKQVLPPVEDDLSDALHALNQSAQYFARMGLAMAKAGRMQEAARYYERALAQEPDDVHSHVNLIGIYNKLKQDALVESHYRALLKVGPNRALGHYYYGEYAMQRKRPEIAMEAFRKALQFNPLHTGAHTNYGLLLQTRGRIKEAEQHFRKALETDPGNRPALFNMGRLLIERGKNSEGLAYLKRALTPVDTMTPTYLIAVAIAYEKSKDFMQALDYADQARNEALNQGQTQLANDIATYMGRLQTAAR